MSREFLAPMNAKRKERYRPTKREQGVVVVRRVSDPTPSTKELEQALIEALSQASTYKPTVRDERARRFYGITNNLEKVIAEVKQDTERRKENGEHTYWRTG
jgi:hypothetical protein